jgi:hypothetical protein
VYPRECFGHLTAVRVLHAHKQQSFRRHWFIFRIQRVFVDACRAVARVK